MRKGTNGTAVDGLREAQRQLGHKIALGGFQALIDKIHNLYWESCPCCGGSMEIREGHDRTFQQVWMFSARSSKDRVPLRRNR